jgi:Cu-Zn family superoxide dismutase
VTVVILFLLLIILGVWWWIPHFWEEHSAEAVAELQGGPLAPELSGTVWFIPVHGGTEVVVEVAGLPPYQPAQADRPPIGPHGFHIHENGDCTVGDPENPFLAAGEHYNPTDQPHGNHAGDLPILFSNYGFAKMQVFTSAFRPEDVIGRSVIIHLYPDDYRTQPAGNSGPRLACGVIVDTDR